MKILAIDTSSIACSLGLLLFEKKIIKHVISPMQQARLILPMLKELLQSENVSLNQLDAISFGCGPGSFTGIRIATSVAQGLAFASEKPLIPISSLAIAAQTAYEKQGFKKMIVAYDARIHEVYWASYEVKTNGLVSLVGKEALDHPEAITVPDKTLWYGVGNAWNIYPDKILYTPAAIDSHCLPSASAMLTLAKAKFLSQEWVSPLKAMPVYLRDNVAQKKSGGC
ncbi:MAG: peptidase M22 glycoprotease [uncultured bacterium]|nr:MAG: peptidase M22 glycoprotease [uncultured bacterium]